MRLSPCTTCGEPARRLLNEVGFNSDWIEKCLAHEDGRSSRGVYNKAEYEPQRRHMLQQWANMVDAWIKGEKYVAGSCRRRWKLLRTTHSLGAYRT